MNEPTTLQEAQAIASAAGVKLTAADYRQIAELQQAVQAPPEATAGHLSAFIAAFNRYYPEFLRGLVGLGEVLVTTSQTFIVSFGVPIVLVLLLIVEHSRVNHGIQLFETSPALASFAAWSLVILNLTLEFVVHHIEHKAGYHAHRAQRFSIRLQLEKLAYMLGLSQNWRPIELSPAQRYRSLLRLVTFTILALALAGSMKTVIQNQSGTWHQALQDILTDSSLSQMSTWAGGLLFALAAVLGAQSLTAYIAVKVTEITGDLEKPSAANLAGEAAAVQYIMAKVAQKNPSIVPSLEGENPFLLPVMTTPNGKNGHY